MKNLKDLFVNLDSLDLHIMKIGLKICFIILLVSIAILSFYLLVKPYVFLYNLGISIFRLSTYIAIEFIICGFVMDKIKNGA